MKRGVKNVNQKGNNKNKYNKIKAKLYHKDLDIVQWLRALANFTNSSTHHPRYCQDKAIQAFKNLA